MPAFKKIFLHKLLVFKLFRLLINISNSYIKNDVNSFCFVNPKEDPLLFHKIKATDFLGPMPYHPTNHIYLYICIDTLL